MNLLSPQFCLLFGIVIASLRALPAPLLTKTKTWSTRILQLSVVLLGCSLNFKDVIQDGASGALITLISLLATFGAGLLMARLLKLERKLSLLLTMGTAICGGSAIAALAPVIAADGAVIATAMGVVFLLNAVAVYLFPILCEVLSLNAEQFGLWSALAIHDTSSVVAAASQHGPQALAIASTVKLTRALWIIPITLIFSLLEKRDQKLTIPWFIAGFLACSLIFTFVSLPPDVSSFLPKLSKFGFTVTLFLIGLGFNLQKIKAIGLRPLVFGVSLWVLVSVTSLLYVRM
jgi:uncharacterized integral membrane protein (TIGR00698 family)